MKHTVEDFHDIAIDAKAFPFGHTVMIDGQKINGLERACVVLEAGKLPRVLLTILPKNLTVGGKTLVEWRIGWMDLFCNALRKVKQAVASAKRSSFLK